MKIIPLPQNPEKMLPRFTPAKMSEGAKYVLSKYANAPKAQGN